MIRRSPPLRCCQVLSETAHPPEATEIRRTTGIMIMRNDAELALVERARGLLPAGGLGNIASDTIIARGRAGRVWDVSGREYVDLLLGSGPMLVGHAHPEVTQAVLEQVAARHDLLYQQRTGNPAGGRNHKGGGMRGKGAVRQQRDRGRLVCDAAGSCLPPARQDPEVRGWLSRHERLWADEPVAGTSRQFPSGRARFRRHPSQRARRCAG